MASSPDEADDSAVVWYDPDRVRARANYHELWRWPMPPPDADTDHATRLDVGGLEKIHAHYGSDIAELAEAAGERGADPSHIEAALRETEEMDMPYDHRELADRIGTHYSKARAAMLAMSDVGDFFECYDQDWTPAWVRCSEFVADLCAERDISLYRYFEMKDELEDFQDLVIEWYVRRNRRQTQTFRLCDLKRRYVHILQALYFEDKPVKVYLDEPGDFSGPRHRLRMDHNGLYYEVKAGDEEWPDWSRHIAARYLRTAQDSIERAHNLTH